MGEETRPPKNEFGRCRFNFFRSERRTANGGIAAPTQPTPKKNAHLNLRGYSFLLHRVVDTRRFPVGSRHGVCRGKKTREGARTQPGSKAADERQVLGFPRRRNAQSKDRPATSLPSSTAVVRLLLSQRRTISRPPGETLVYPGYTLASLRTCMRPPARSESERNSVPIFFLGG